MWIIGLRIEVVTEKSKGYCIEKNSLYKRWAKVFWYTEHKTFCNALNFLLNIYFYCNIFGKCTKIKMRIYITFQTFIIILWRWTIFFLSKKLKTRFSIIWITFNLNYVVNETPYIFWRQLTKVVSHIFWCFSLFLFLINMEFKDQRSYLTRFTSMN